MNLGELSSRYNLCTRVCTISSRIFPNSLRFVTLHESVPCFHGSRCFARTTLSSLKHMNTLLTLQDPLLWLKVTILYFNLEAFFSNLSLSLFLPSSLWPCSKWYIEKSRLSWVISKQPFLCLSGQYSAWKGSEHSFQLFQFGISLQLHVSMKGDSVAIWGPDVHGAKSAEQIKLDVKEFPLSKRAVM